MSIKSTTRYDLFVNIRGNRPVDKNHVKNLVQSIAENNLLEYNPIIVNEKMEIIDGQHRLAAAKESKKTIFYIIAPKADIADVQRLNQGMENWNLWNFIENFVERGNSDYQVLSDYGLMYGFAPTLAAGLLTGNMLKGTKGDNISMGKAIRSGTFKVTEQSLRKAEQFAEMYMSIKSFTAPRVGASRDFIRGLWNYGESHSLKELLANLKEHRRVISRMSNATEYKTYLEAL